MYAKGGLMIRRVSQFVIFAAAVSIVTSAASSRELSRSFELRHVTDDVRADGETDFMGETEFFDTGQRVDFLRAYGDFARRFFNDPDLDTEVVTDAEADAFLASMKPRPMPRIRKTIRLEDLTWTAHAPGLRDRENEALARWVADGASNDAGVFKITGERAAVTMPVTSCSWRFKLSWTVTVPAGADASIGLSGERDAVTVAFGPDGGMTFTDGAATASSADIPGGVRRECVIEADLGNGGYNLMVNGAVVADFLPLSLAAGDSVTALTFSGTRGVVLDDVLLTAFTPTDDVRRPYFWTTVIDQDFELPPAMDGWTRPGYDDGSWGRCDLPKVHGGERFAGQDLYLRKTVKAGAFERAVLDIEALDPGGEVWVNGTAAAVIHDRRPARVDVTGLLVPGGENLIAVRVNSFSTDRPMGHSPLDTNIGWFAGRISLDLTARTWIDDVFVWTLHTDDPALTTCRIRFANLERTPFNGNVRIEWRRWFPRGEETAHVFSFPVSIRAFDESTEEYALSIPSPALWTCDDPNLYEVTVVLENGAGEPVDDRVITTGIRTVGQDGGTFRLNGRPAMLNGAQIMGFRTPVETSAMTNRCAPARRLAKEMMQTKRMNGNLMRVHVHAWQGPDGNINDPRIAEICDQLGLMLIWGTTAWIRSEEAFAVDFEGYPQYMRQVYNHPSIVMWEVSNHPNQFRNYGMDYTHDFCEACYSAIAPVDMSRLISFTSFIRHLHYANDRGTVDHDGNPIRAAAAWTAPMVTRGNQDSITGYTKDWSVLRTWPPDYYRDFLESRERAYFNFEHEESIGQPNWNLAKGKPWYRLQSYEWPYDEGTIGRRLSADEWLESQAWQAFSAWESMKKQRMLDYDGFSWCCLHGGANSGTYKKPLIDCLGHAKLAFHVNAMAFQDIIAGSGNVDTVYGPGDKIEPVIINLGVERRADLLVRVMDETGTVVDERTYEDVTLPAGRTVTRLETFRPSFSGNGRHFIEYHVSGN